MKLPPPEPSTHPVDVGLRTEAHNVSELVQRGYSVLFPLGVNQRYDLVLEIAGAFIRVQCKTGHIRGGFVEYSTVSVRSNTTEVITRGYQDEIEMFLVYCPATDQIYAVPIEEAPRSKGYLRIEATKNGQERHVRWARDYELPG